MFTTCHIDYFVFHISHQLYFITYHANYFVYQICDIFIVTAGVLPFLLRNFSKVFLVFDKFTCVITFSFICPRRVIGDWIVELYFLQFCYFEIVLFCLTIVNIFKSQIMLIPVKVWLSLQLQRLSHWALETMWPK